MRVDEFDFDLPEDRIALRPARPRDASRLLVVRPDSRPLLDDRSFTDLPQLLRSGDVVVFNDTRVLPAALEGVREREGQRARVSVTLLKRIDAMRWDGLARPAKRLRQGDRIRFGGEGRLCLLGTLDATVEGRGAGGEVRLRFDFHGSVLDEALEAVGAMPLPPYIASRRPTDDCDAQDYQTIFARQPGAVAAPTAGLHFTERIMKGLESRGISHCFMTLHVGAGTFQPVRADDTEDHQMHGEWGSISAQTADMLNAVR
ncbi:MAG: tRNA preQ1(34) S-adenosylmethionine ribosyltransferase-isomerase QueA, partial [Alphaproteobacteria bacterium]